MFSVFVSVFVFHFFKLFFWVLLYWGVVFAFCFSMVAFFFLKKEKTEKTKTKAKTKTKSKKAKPKTKTMSVDHHALLAQHITRNVVESCESLYKFGGTQGSEIPTQ